MNTYLITYDLNRPGQNYSTLYGAIINAAGNNWCHPLESVWLIKHVGNALTVCNYLKQFIDANDKLLVSQITRDTAWLNLNQEVADWLNSNL